MCTVIIFIWLIVDKILNMTEFNYHYTCMDDLFMSGNEWIISKDLNNNKMYVIIT